MNPREQLLELVRKKWPNADAEVLAAAFEKWLTTCAAAEIICQQEVEAATGFAQEITVRDLLEIGTQYAVSSAGIGEAADAREAIQQAITNAAPEISEGDLL